MVDFCAGVDGQNESLVTVNTMLKNDLPKMRGVLVSTFMSRTTKSTGMKKFQILTRMFSAIPAG